jgi:hypothetical protein
MGDKTRGIYNKFVVLRTDGTSAPGQKHDGCYYFVLDLDHDPHARAALAAYRESCKAEHPMLADDLSTLLYRKAFGGTPTAELGRSSQGERDE